MSSTHIGAKLRRAVIKRANGRCEYCLMPEKFSIDTFHIDHITSLKQHGPTELANLAWACALCNLFKGDSVSAKFYEENLLVPLYNPRTDKWTDHFDLQPDGELLPNSNVARGTIKVLRLNDEERITERLALIAMDIDLL